MAKEIHYFGIRHHGPGSAKRLLAALEQLQPCKVLIEGPADCSDLLGLLADRRMQPPLALLAYAAEDAANSFYYPFAEFSPEYQASLWALANEAELRYIDLPAGVQLAVAMAATEEGEDSEDPSEAEDPTEDDLAVIRQDPIGELARLAGYEDGEAWWNDLIEQNADQDSGIFTTVELAMASLRGQFDADSPAMERDRVREAQMRLEIAKAAREADGPVAVVCGAWHVPALKARHTAKDDRALLKTLPRKLPPSKVKMTWVPWTSPRLATASGYGAGVPAPMWYLHLWRHRDQPEWLEHWLGRIARALRADGHLISTASVIEAARLSSALAVVRNRPCPGFEEIREAVVACLCFGESLLWQSLESRILLGNQVGEVSPDAPLVPLLEDLQRQQKRCKLKPESLQKEVSLDLRSDAGAAKSVLLHRLLILQVPWGELADSGRSRGTFRERWLLAWQPEYSVRLVENMVYGSTIEQAANARISEALTAERQLNRLAEAVQECLEARLEPAAEAGLNQLEIRAAQAGDCIELLQSLPPLVNLVRYGTAREISLEHVASLTQRLTIQTAIALPYACRNLNAEEAEHYRQMLDNAHQAVLLAEMPAELTANWWSALDTVAESSHADLKLAGLCARLLYQSDRLSADALQILLQRMLSPGTPTSDAARFFDGFFTDAASRLLYDPLLRQAVEEWLLSLDGQDFIEYLPLFRRVFASLDGTERQRMIQMILHAEGKTADTAIAPQGVALWPAQFERLQRLLAGDTTWSQ